MFKQRDSWVIKTKGKQSQMRSQMSGGLQTLLKGIRRGFLSLTRVASGNSDVLFLGLNGKYTMLILSWIFMDSQVAFYNTIKALVGGQVDSLRAKVA